MLPVNNRSCHAEQPATAAAPPFRAIQLQVQRLFATLAATAEPPVLSFIPKQNADILWS